MTLNALVSMPKKESLMKMKWSVKQLLATWFKQTINQQSLQPQVFSKPIKKTSKVFQQVSVALSSSTKWNKKTVFLLLKSMLMHT